MMFNSAFSSILLLLLPSLLCAIPHPQQEGDDPAGKVCDANSPCPNGYACSSSPDEGMSRNNGEDANVKHCYRVAYERQRCGFPWVMCETGLTCLPERPEAPRDARDGTERVMPDLSVVRGDFNVCTRSGGGGGDVAVMNSPNLDDRSPSRPDTSAMDVTHVDSVDAQVVDQNAMMLAKGGGGSEERGGEVVGGTISTIQSPSDDYLG